MRFSAIFPAFLLAFSTLACGSAPSATDESAPSHEPTHASRAPGLKHGPEAGQVQPIPGKTCADHPCPEGFACQDGDGLVLCFAPPPVAKDPEETPPEPKPDCVTDADCDHGTAANACLVFRCQGGSCFAHERDDDGDGKSLCAGGMPGSEDCNDNDASIHPDAIDVCGDGIDNDCNGLVDDGCYEFCDTLGGPQNEGKHWERGCCATPAGAFPGVFLDGLKKPAPTHTDVFKSADSPFVYYLAGDGKRYIFPLAANFASWFGKVDADGIPSLDASICGRVTEYPSWTVAAIPIGGNVGFRPGTFITGIESDPKRFLAWPNQAWAKAGGHDSILRHLLPEVASELFPSGTSARTILTPDAFFIAYGIGAQMEHNEPAAPKLNPANAGGIDQYLGLAPIVP